jgi:hypothetical protein
MACRNVTIAWKSAKSWTALPAVEFSWSFCSFGYRVPLLARKNPTPRNCHPWDSFVTPKKALVRFHAESEGRIYENQ